MGAVRKDGRVFCQKNIAVYADPGFGSSDAGSIFMDDIGIVKTE